MTPDWFSGLLTGIMLGFPLTYLATILYPDLRSEVRAWRRGRR